MVQCGWVVDVTGAGGNGRVVFDCVDCDSFRLEKCVGCRMTKYNERRNAVGEKYHVRHGFDRFG